MQNNPSQLEMFAVPSPCIGVCQSGPKGYCLGCFRSRDERLYWHQVDDATKRAIVKACYRRKRLAIARNNKNNKTGNNSDSSEDNQQQSLF